MAQESPGLRTNVIKMAKVMDKRIVGFLVVMILYLPATAVGFMIIDCWLKTNGKQMGAPLVQIIRSVSLGIKVGQGLPDCKKRAADND